MTKFVRTFSLLSFCFCIVRVDFEKLVHGKRVRERERKMFENATNSHL